MNKIIRIVVVIAAVLALAISLTACGNENWGIGNYTFTHVHIGDGVEGHCATVSSWHDNDLGVELHTNEFGSIYCSEGTYFLFEQSSDCPFCKE
jgi:predicted small secreted protein